MKISKYGHYSMRVKISCDKCQLWTEHYVLEIDEWNTITHTICRTCGNEWKAKDEKR